MPNVLGGGKSQWQEEGRRNPIVRVNSLRLNFKKVATRHEEKVKVTWWRFRFFKLPLSFQMERKQFPIGRVPCKFRNSSKSLIRELERRILKTRKKEKIGELWQERPYILKHDRRLEGWMEFLKWRQLLGAIFGLSWSKIWIFMATEIYARFSSCGN